MPSVRKQVAKCLLDVAGNADVYCRSGKPVESRSSLCPARLGAQKLKAIVAPHFDCRKVTEPLFVAALLTRIFFSHSEIRRQTANPGPARASLATRVPSFFAPFARQSRIDSEKEAFRAHDSANHAMALEYA